MSVVARASAPREPGAPREAAPVAWHALSPEEALERLGSSEHGLAAADAARRLARDGPNALKSAPRASALSLLLAQLESVVVLLLVAAALIAALMGERLDAAAIAAVLVLNVSIGFVTELRARRAIEALLRLEALSATVVRQGVTLRIPASDLVVGDVFEVEAGQRVPADGRVLSAAELRADEAILTGESMPVDKRVVPPVAAETSLADRLTMLHSGTSVVAGRGRALATGTGMATEVGRIGTLVGEARPPATPLERRLDALGKQLAVAALAGALLVALVRLGQSGASLALLQMVIAVAIAAVPEGLPAVSTIAMAVGVRRMTQRRALIRRLPIVESLGSATVVCTDKTGTLTAGIVRVTVCWAGGREWSERAWRGIALAPSTPADASPEALLLALRIGALANRAQLDGDAGSGDPTEIALLRVAADAGIDRERERRDRPEVWELPFSSERMVMATVHRERDRGLVAFVKGAPFAIFERCVRLRVARGEVPLDDGWRRALRERNDEMAARGLRVLALAAGPVDGTSDEALRDLTLVGLVGMEDPPAPGVRETIALLHGAGVRTLMLTGDQRGTARAIARALGVGGDQPIALDGREIEEMDEAALDRAASELGVVSRVSPASKLRVVAALQRRGDVVAMLGDGVNDAPALRQADVGVAMGGRGSDVAREAAGVVLQDDRFETVAAAVEEGRRIDVNIRRAIFYLVSCNLGELLVLIAAGLLRWPVPLTPLQILWLNLLTDTLPALALAVAPGGVHLMRQPPRPPGSPALSRAAAGAAAAHAMLIAGVSLASFAMARAADPTALDRARTICFLTLGFAQIAHLSNVRGRSGAWGILGAAALVTLALQLASVLLPPFARVLRAVPPDRASDWLVSVALALVPALAGWIALRVARPSRSPGAPSHA